MSRFCCVPRARHERKIYWFELKKKKYHTSAAKETGARNCLAPGLAPFLTGQRSRTGHTCDNNRSFLVSAPPPVYFRTPLYEPMSPSDLNHAPSRKSPQVFALGTPCLISPPQECQLGYPHQNFIFLLTIFTD